MLGYWRTALYLCAAGAIWFAEDAVFSLAFRFGILQTCIVTVYFVGLFICAVWYVFKLSRQGLNAPSESELPIAKIVSMAPVLAVVLGSFAALPIFLLVLLVGALF